MDRSLGQLVSLANREKPCVLRARLCSLAHMGVQMYHIRTVLSDARREN
jgi:hypothetical protein